MWGRHRAGGSWWEGPASSVLDAIGLAGAIKAAEWHFTGTQQAETRWVGRRSKGGRVFLEEVSQSSEASAVSVSPLYAPPDASAAVSSPAPRHPVPVGDQ